MSNNDNGGSDGSEDKVKWCPFLDQYCIEDRCALHAEVRKNVGGLQQKATLCTFNAQMMMLSEINAKTQPPQQKGQKFILPG